MIFSFVAILLVLGVSITTLHERWHEQAIELVAKLNLEPGVLDFLRGVAVGRQK